MIQIDISFFVAFQDLIARKCSAARAGGPETSFVSICVKWLLFLSHRCRSASPILAVWCSSSGSGAEVASGTKGSVIPNRPYVLNERQRKKRCDIVKDHMDINLPRQN